MSHGVGLYDRSQVYCTRTAYNFVYAYRGLL